MTKTQAPSHGYATLAKRIAKARGKQGWIAFGKRIGVNYNTLRNICSGTKPRAGTVLHVKAALDAAADEVGQ